MPDLKPTNTFANLPILFSPLGLNELDDSQKNIIAQIDSLLPQTQCGLCGHIDGCLPYAYSIVIKGENHNLCVPGGQAVTDAIFDTLTAHHIHREVLPATPSKWQTNPDTNRPIEVRAIIDEDNCIGCTKCIPACPVDAIIGTAKHMHTIITDLCTGCELCLPPCPVDCIRLEPYPRTQNDAERKNEEISLKKRYHHHLNRVENNIKDGNKPVVSSVESVMSNVISQVSAPSIDKSTAQNTIEMAKLRAQIKKLTKQLTQKDDPVLHSKLMELKQALAQLENQTTNPITAGCQ